MSPPHHPASPPRAGTDPNVRRREFGGRPTVARLLRSDDSQRLLAFFKSHTPETVRSRYGYCVGEMSAGRAAELVGVDQTIDSALGIFEGTGAAQRLVAIGRCYRLPGQATAEIAFVVHEERRRLGMAAALYDALSEIMRARGVTRFVAQVEQDNAAMLGLFLRHGGKPRSIPGTNALEVRIPLR